MMYIVSCKPVLVLCDVMFCILVFSLDGVIVCMNDRALLAVAERLFLVVFSLHWLSLDYKGGNLNISLLEVVRRHVMWVQHSSSTLSYLSGT